MRSQSFFAFVFAAVLALPAAAQNPPENTPTRIRGTVEKLDGQSLTVKSRDGQSLMIALAPNFTVRGVVAKTVADIKPGDFVASTSVKGPDGKLRAIEVHILPDSLRGVAREGQFPWDLVPGEHDDQRDRGRDHQRTARPGDQGHLQGRRGRSDHSPGRSRSSAMCRATPAC